MRIIGGNDYYDVALIHGMDPKIVFNRGKYNDKYISQSTKHHMSVREFDTLYFDVHVGTFGYKFNQEVNERDRYTRLSAYAYAKHSAGSNYIYTLDLYGITYYAIGVLFCGKRYCGIKFKDDVIWDFDSLVNYFAKHNLTLDLKSKNYQKQTQEERLINFFKPSSFYFEDMIKHRFSIVIFDKDNVNIDTDGLKEIKFSRVFDSYSAMQELSMWYGGVLQVPANEMVIITDEKTLVKKHGFDKLSFRHPVK